MGPGHIKYLTQDAIDSIRRAELVLAFGRIAETAEALGFPVVRIKSVSEVLEHVPSDKRIALLASGDPGFYGILEYLKKQNVAIERVVPGLSSFQYLMAMLQKSWQHAGFISLHGRDNGLEQVKRHGISVMLTDRQHTPRAISKQLRHMGIAGKLYVGYNLSYENECIVEASIGDAIEECTDISIVVVEPI
jgi:cobalt-precorrin-7 (C5)-methyltransferase